MNKFMKAALSTLIGLSVLAASSSTQAHAGKKQNRLAAGLAIGAIAGIIVAGEINRHAEKRRNRKKAHHRRSRKPDYREVRKTRRNRQRLQRSYQDGYRGRYYENFRDYERDRFFARDFSLQDSRDLFTDDHFAPEPAPDFPRRNTMRLSRQNDRHIQRCIQTYPTYDPRSDTYIKRDGSEHICRK